MKKSEEKFLIQHDGVYPSCFLPNEIWLKIFLEFSFFGLAQMACTKKEWNQYILSTLSIWKNLYQAYFPHIPYPFAKFRDTDNSERIRRAFKGNYLSLSKEEKELLSQFWLEKKLFVTEPKSFPNSLFIGQLNLTWLLHQKALTDVEKQYLFHYLLFYGNLTQVDLKNGRHGDCRTYIEQNYRILLYRTMKYHQWGAVAWLIEEFTCHLQKAKASEPNLIFMALQHNQSEVAIKLISKQEDVNQKLMNGSKPLCIVAFELGYVEVAKAIINSTKFRDHTLAFKQALAFDYDDLITLLQPYITPDPEMVYSAIEMNQFDMALEFIFTLSQGKALLYSDPILENSCLHLAAKKSSPLLVQSLIQSGHYSSIKNKEGKDPLALALETSQVENIPILLNVHHPIKILEQPLLIYAFACSFKSGVAVLECMQIKYNDNLNCLFDLCEDLLNYNLGSPSLFWRIVEKLETMYEKDSEHDRQFKKYFSHFWTSIQRLPDTFNYNLSLPLNNEIAEWPENIQLLWNQILAGKFENIKKKISSAALLNQLEKKLSLILFRDKHNNTWIHLLIQYLSIENFRTREVLFEIIEFFIQSGLDINAQNDKGETALHLAIYRNIRWCYFLLSQQADVTLKNDKEQSVLHLAAQKGITEVFLKGNWTATAANQKDKDFKTPLYCAAKYECLEIIQTLVEKGASLEDLDDEGNNLLQVACLSEKSDFLEKKPLLIKLLDVLPVEIIKKLGLKENYLDKSLITFILHLASHLKQKNSDEKILLIIKELILSHSKLFPLILDKIDIEGHGTLLHFFAYACPKLMDYLLKDIPNMWNLLSIVNDDDETPLLCAAKNPVLNGFLSIFDFLQKNFSDEILIQQLGHLNRKGKNALYYLIKNNHLKKLNENILSFLKRSYLPSCFLHQIIKLTLSQNKIEVLDHFLGLGFITSKHFNKENRQGDTALISALNKEDFELAKCLFKYGARFRIQDFESEEYQDKYLKVLKHCSLPYDFLFNLINNGLNQNVERFIEKLLELKILPANNFTCTSALHNSVEYLIDLKKFKLAQLMLKHGGVIKTENLLPQSDEEIITCQRIFFIFMGKKELKISKQFLHRFFNPKNKLTFDSYISALKVLAQSFPENPLWQVYTLEIQNLKKALEQTNEKSLYKNLESAFYLKDFFETLFYIQAGKDERWDLQHNITNLKSLYEPWFHFSYCSLPKSLILALNIGMGLMLGALLSAAVVCPVVLVAFSLAIQASLTVIILSCTIVGSAALGATTAGVITAKNLHVGRFFKTEYERKQEDFIESLNAADILSKIPTITDY